MTRASSLAESGVFVVIEINRGPSGSPGPDKGPAGGCSSTPQPSDPPGALLGRLFGDSGYANAGATQSVLDVAARLIRTAARPPRDRPSWVHRSPGAVAVVEAPVDATEGSGIDGRSCVMCRPHSTQYQ